MAERQVKEGTFITLLPFMVNDLSLSGDQLMVYAMIYGFSQDGESRMTGGLTYMANWLGKSKQSASRAVNSLIEMGYVKKYEKWDNGVKYCEYTAVREVVPYMERGYSAYGTGCSTGGTGCSTGGTGYSADGMGGIPPVERGYSAGGTKNILKNKQSELKGNKKKYSVVFSDFAKGNHDLLEALQEFENMRDEMKCPLTERAKQILVKKLCELSKDVNEQIAILEQSTVSNWKSVYPLKQETQSSGQASQKKEFVFDEQWMREVGITCG